MPGEPRLRALLLGEVLRDVHHYAPSREPSRPTITGADPEGVQRLRVQARDRLRDLVERAAARGGFTHRHYDPEQAAARLLRVLELEDGLQLTYDRLCDERSRRAMLDVLKLRVLGPYHAPLAVTPEAYRAKQDHVEREFRIAYATMQVSDPWFSPISLYRIPMPGGGDISLHSHSVDIVSVFLLGQYSLCGGGCPVTVARGDVVLDVGGCWGDTALLFAHQVGPEGKVFTFEFDPENLEVMQRNLDANPHLAERIEVVQRAVWERSGAELPFVGAGRITTVFEPGSVAETGQVSTVSIDDFVRESGIDRLGLIKMDVEGVELNVLGGATGTLRKLKPSLALAAYHRDDDLVRIPESIAASGVPYALGLASYSPLEDETVLYATARSSAT